MGCWGEESCSNDHCWDMLNALDIHKMTQKESNSSVYESFKVQMTDTTTIHDLEAFLGVVIWVLDHGKSVKKKYLARALKIVKKMHSNIDLGTEGNPYLYLDGWRYPKARKEALADEIKIIEYAQNHDGKAKIREVEGLMDKMAHLIEE